MKQREFNQVARKVENERLCFGDLAVPLEEAIA
jgi:hypothetical protein